MSIRNPASRFLHRLRRNRSGVAMVEFALAAPFFLTAGLGGVELANYTVVNMQIAQIAIHIADNASRIGDTSVLENKKIYESDINDLLLGASLQAGDRLDLWDRGRVIISSLEVQPDSDPEAQYIHWQRCMGKKDYHSTYGNVDDTFAIGMGPPGQEVFANAGEAVIFVELVYDYEPLVSRHFISDETVKAIATFTVRSSRDLEQVYQRSEASPDTVSACDRFTNDFADVEV
ncbi:TadE/TadG family type IV pilus assembly protein [Novosphingobium aquimarinum]|uniref:TadE/TadG family type IV pilus assembly protein n=1 Tax=Novosphingobium aquimarinum TaxID=2682494 RepID=UPI0012ECADDB|nr:TadE/TadG family type IV pilus assembly protein [Novosphingobium aquimarinum]